MKFVKMHGIGNDFVLIDHVPIGDVSAFSRAVCHRKFGVGADGLLCVTEDHGMRMFNPDGSESEMCGNGLRAFAKYLTHLGITSETIFDIQTGAGKLSVSILEDGQVTVNMGLAKLKPSEIGMKVDSENFINQPIGAGFRGTAVSMGNPHLVIFVDKVDKVALEKLGPLYENYQLFPNRTNVHFVEVVAEDHLMMRTWERGAGATLACGTGACSVAVAGYLNGFSEREVKIDLPGGRLHLEYKESGHVFMTGPAEIVYEGQLGDFLKQSL